MFIHDFVLVDMPADRAWTRLAAAGGEWLAGLAASAAGDVEALLTVADEPGARSHVRLDVGAPYRRRDVMCIPLRWHVTGADPVFTHLDGDLSIAPLGPAQAQISLLGRYEAGGALSTPAELVRHRVAETWVRAFLSDLAAELLAEPAAGPMPARWTIPMERRRSPARHVAVWLVATPPPRVPL